MSLPDYASQFDALVIIHPDYMLLFDQEARLPSEYKENLELV